MVHTETGCRLGELLKMQWREVDENRCEIRVRVENVKDGEAPVIPATVWLRAVLEMAAHDPAGERFGRRRSSSGEQIANVARA